MQLFLVLVSLSLSFFVSFKERLFNKFPRFEIHHRCLSYGLLAFGLDFQFWFSNLLPGVLTLTSKQTTILGSLCSSFPPLLPLYSKSFLLYFLSFLF
jgi:hypothetical protein